MKKIDNYLDFYRSQLKLICQKIDKGKVGIFIGINSIGKTLLTLQLSSADFKNQFIGKQKVNLIFLEFKDKTPPTSEQLYKYWLTKTALALHYPLPKNEVFNDFSFHFYLSDMVKKQKRNAKVVFVLLDVQNILNQKEGFFKSLMYLHRFTYGQVSYILFSEPHILHTKNIWMQRFIQDFTRYSFQYLRLFDKKTIQADIIREEKFLQTKLNRKQHRLIEKYCGGLHGVIGALCYFLKNNPTITDIRQLKKIVFADDMFKYWIDDILDSLPKESQRILKEIVKYPHNFSKYKRSLYGKYLLELGFVSNSGRFLHPLMTSYVKNYSITQGILNTQLRMVNNQFYVKKDIIPFTKKEKAVLEKLFLLKGKVVSYDTMGEILWKNNPESFSLWSISQIIRRIRKKLSFYSINPKVICSLRGQGYLFN
jgi:DNA-binding winged helix-turn-helix (wHTH) protein